MLRGIRLALLLLVAGIVAGAAVLGVTVGFSSSSDRSPTSRAPSAPAPSGDQEAPVRAAFYFPGFPDPEGWATHYTPTRGKYDSGDSTVLAAHVADARYAGLTAFIADWSPGTATGARLPQLLDAAAVGGLGVAAYYDQAGVEAPNESRVRDQLSAIPRDHPAYLRLHGKPVLFVRNGNDSTCATVEAWRRIAAGWYLDMKVFPNFSSCPVQPDSWHQYAPATPYSTHAKEHATVSPGLWRSQEDAPRLARDPVRFRADLSRVADAGVDWQLVTSFNGWGEGSSVEPAAEWTTPSGMGAYLDAMHDVFVNGVRYDASGAVLAGDRPPPPAPGDVVVMAAGDIACDPTAAPDAAQGNGTRTCAQNRVARQIAAADPDAVLPLGDNQYERGSLAAYRASYDATWGELKGISYPAPGNHEWLTRDAEGYREYFASGTPKEVDEVRGYYSFDLEGWHFVSLDSDCSKVGGCQKDSPMYTWLAEDLAVHAGRPTVVYWHHPRWSSGEHGSMDMTEPLWELLLADRDVQILLSGHDHDYERFAPMGPTGPEPGGIRQFVAGTGGNNHTCAGPAGPIAGSEAFDCTVFGALQLTLHPDGSYDWFFTGAQGTGTYTDHGTQAHR